MALLVSCLWLCVAVCRVDKIVQCCGNVVVNFVSFQSINPSIIVDVVLF